MELPWSLNADEARVLGALVEKEISTPEYYPLSLNALVHACNQKSNRDPVTDLDETQVRLALRNLQEKRLVQAGADHRVPRFRHQLQEALNLTRGQTALLCVLLLRGAQTPGELRARSERLYRFAELDEAQAALQQLIQRDPPLAAELARQPGTKEARYAHRLSGPVATAPEAGDAPLTPSDRRRLDRLEAEVEALRMAVEKLRERFPS